MSKAEEKTTELMKKAKDFIPDGGYSEKELNLAFFMFIKGYNQAEKDLELTWEDIETIGELRLNVALELRRKELESPIKNPLKFTTEDMCKEVLKRFKAIKETKD